MDTTFLVLLVVVVVLMMVSPMYKRSKTYHKNMFGANEVASLGRVENIEVFALGDQEFGPLVGLVMSGADDDLRLSITREDARLLAQMLETAAHDAQQ